MPRMIPSVARSVSGAISYASSERPAYRGGGATSAAGYMLDDDGTNAATFLQSWLETIAPDHLQAQYTATGSSASSVALPASITAAPGLVTLVEGVPVVCGFVINALPTTGTLNNFNVGLYNYGGSGSVLLNVEVSKDPGATTGEIKAQSGTYPPSVTQFGSSYFGELVGAKIAIQATLASGSLTAKAFYNGVLIGTSTGIATNGGVIALMQILDGATSTPGSVVDISCVPTVEAGLGTDFGAFDSGAVDMIGGAVPVFDPLSITGTRDLHKWTETAKMRTTYDSPTPGVVVGDPIGYWMGTRGVMLFEATTSTVRPEYNAAGVRFNATSSSKNITNALAQAATAPYFVCVRMVNNASLTAPYVGLHSGSITGTGNLHVATNDTSTGRKSAFSRATQTVTANEGQGDSCYVYSFDGTSAFMIDEAGTKTTLTVGAGASAGTYERMRGPVGTIDSIVKYRQSGTAAISEANARAWIAWAKGQP